MATFTIRNKTTSTAFSGLIFLLTMFSFSQKSIYAQEVADLALRARVNLYEKWNIDSAAYYFRKIIDKKETPAFAYSDYGWYLLLEDKVEEGLGFIQKAAEMDPNDVQLSTWCSWALLWKKNTSSSKLWIDRALILDPTNGEALHVACRVAVALEDFEEALHYASRIESQSSPYRAILPVLYAKMGKFEEARKWAKKFSNDYQKTDLWMLMETYTLLGEDDTALKYLQLVYDNKHPFMPWLRIDPGLSGLQGYPLFEKIVSELRHPD